MSAPDHTTAEAGAVAMDAAFTDKEQHTASPSAASEIYSDTEKAPIGDKQQESPRSVHGVKWILAVSSVLISAFLFVSLQ